MAVEFGVWQAKVLQAGRNRIAGVIAHDEEGRGACLIVDAHRLRVVGAEKGVCSCRHSEPILPSISFDSPGTRTCLPVVDAARRAAGHGVDRCGWTMCRST